MRDTTQVEKILHTVKAKIDAHNEFKEAYNEQLALDFNLFNFFGVGENKISTILAYFLDPKETHGQSDKFLKEFLSLFDEVIDGETQNQYRPFDTKVVNIKCEYGITDGRRIDILMKLGDCYIAIENKVWAVDQKNQLHDYANYLNMISKGNYLLLYLNPYGDKPSIGSIDNELHDTLETNQKLRTISYTKEIIPLLDKWLSVCKADNVTFFLKQFKSYLLTEFIGNNDLTMTNTLKDLIYSKSAEIETLFAAYNDIKKEVIQSLAQTANHLQNVPYTPPVGVVITKGTIFTHAPNVQVYKWGLKRNEDEIFVQIIQNKINLIISYYTSETASQSFLQKVAVAESNHFDFRSEHPLRDEATTQEAIDAFLKYLKIAEKLFEADH